MSEPAVVVKNKIKTGDGVINEIPIASKIIIEMEQFENLVYQLREAYTEKIRDSQVVKVTFCLISL